MDNINDYNLCAIYLRWCIEHDLLDDDFLQKYADIVKKVKAKPYSLDLRSFIKDELNGQLNPAIFNKTGQDFTAYYYGDNDSPSFPQDIEDYALAYLGSDKYYKDYLKFKNRDLIAFDETYYKAMAQVIEQRFANWQGQRFDDKTLEPSDVALSIIKYLDCECRYFPSMTDDDPIISAYSYARREGILKGFVPVLIVADNETLLESLVFNSDPEHDADIYEFDLKTVTEYRKRMLLSPVKDARAIIDDLIEQRKEEAYDDNMDFDNEILGPMEGGEINDRFESLWQYDTDMTYPLILAKIPVKNPWEIFAYLPFGGWNDCPDTQDLMAVSKYWYEKYGAIAALMSHDELEFVLKDPVLKGKAMEVAIEHFGLCPDLLQNGSIGTLADSLWQSTIWYFWWD